MTNIQRRKLRSERRRTGLHGALITPQEAVSLGSHLTFSAIFRVREIMQAYMDADGKADISLGHSWDELKMLSYIWNAGRVQGIREERTLRQVSR